ncbi:fatty acid desaturase [Mameliella alba]|nr:fatty acid desaturase [Mameliella alba]MBY6171987.1 fatty acid desaturase [Mameliella alba]MBY6177170.1 fatty acid desaturase [Mameliella alba]
MNAIPWKDYSLVSNDGDRGPQTHPTWYAPALDRKTLKALMKRSDRPALANYALWIGLILALGALTVATWGSGWGLVWLVIYSAVHQSATARQHELSHGTPFKTRWLNDLFFHFSSFITLSEGHYYRWRHARHHTHTIIVGKDPEIQSPRPPELISLLINIFNLKTVVITMRDFLRRAAGDLGAGAHFIPESEQRTVITAARVYLGLILLIIGASLLTGSLLPLLLTIGPRVIGAPLYALLHFTQHAGLNEDVYDHRLNSRTIYMNPVLRFLYGNMNYHVEHHMFPMVPYYRLPELHELIKDHCPPPKRGLLDAYRDIVPTLLRQLKDPSYHLQPEVPDAAAKAA